MKNNKLKIFAVLMIVCFTFLFAGCDLFVRNDAYYYNQTVINITYNDGNKIEIDRLEFLNAYNNYGQNLISTYGYTEDKAKEETVNALVNRKILLNEAKRVSLTTEGQDVKLTTSEKQNLYYQVYKSLISNVYDYEDQIREDWDIKAEDALAETTEEGTIYTPYTKKAEPQFDSVDGEYKIKLLENNEEISNSEKIENAQKVYEKFIQETKNNTQDSIAREGYRRYIGVLQASQKVLGTKFTEKQLIEEEISKAYDNLEENKLIEKYQDYKQDNNGYSYITVSQVLDKYKAMITSSKFVYENDSTKFNTDMLENFANVNYFVNDDYFYVAHILIKFDETQEARYKELETLSNNGQGYIISADKYKEEKQKLYNSILADERDLTTGEITKDVTSAKDVLKEIEIALSNASTIEQKNEVFKNFMYKYNEDGGIMNADYPYIIGENDSKMVENFTDASRDLNDNGTYGAISGLVESEYGLHIIYYMGACENVFTIPTDGNIELRANYVIDGNQNYSDVLKLDQTYLNGLNNKTVFDLVYESLESDNYSEFENMNLNTLKEQNGIKVEKVKKLI